MTKINSLEHLKEVCNPYEPEDFFISLNFGLRSSKCITYDEDTDTFFVLNEIDDTEDEFNSEQIMDDNLTDIGKAIRAGQFYHY
jgi:hypothetical protein